MSKKKSPKEEYDNLVKELERSYARWSEIYNHGASDPFWPDGTNLNLVHNHILYYGKQIAELSSKHGLPLPAAFDLPLPPEVDSDYMARREEIRTNAKLSLKAYQDDPNYQQIFEIIKNIGNAQKASIASSILSNVSALRTAISSNDYIAMRRHENPELYLRSAQVFVDELREKDFSSQLSLEEFAVEEETDDEEFEP